MKSKKKFWPTFFDHGFLNFDIPKECSFQREYNRTYSLAHRQPKFYIPRQPTGPKYTFTSAMSARVDEGAEVHKDAKVDVYFGTGGCWGR